MADITGNLMEDYLPNVKFGGIRSNKNMEFGTSATVTLPSDTTIGGSAVVALGDITSSSTTATAFSVTNTGIYTGTGVVKITANSATTGVIGLVTANGLTSGQVLTLTSSGTLVTTAALLTLTANSATTAAGLLRINANGLTEGIGAVITSSATAITSGGRLLRIDHTGATSTSGILTEFASAANDETVIVKITGSAALALGIALDVSLAAMTTGKGIDMSDLDAITTGKAVHIDATGVTQTDGILVHIDSASTALTSTGRLLLVDHTGNAGVSTIIAEVKSAAADETTVFQVLASAALAAGKVVNISGAAVTTGTLLSAANADALTTGMIAQFKSNSADATARTLVDIHNDHASAVGVTPLKITQDAPTSTNFKLMATFGTISLYISDQTSPNTALTAIEGSICLNGSATGQAFWNTDGATAWTALA